MSDELHGGHVTLAAQVAALGSMSTAELAAEFERVYGRRPRYRSAPWMRKRIAFQLQVVAFGGLPSVARAALDKITAEFALPNVQANTPAPTTNDALRPGRVLQREWHGQTVRVVSTADGFEWNGQRFGSLSAVASAITGTKWNGKLFFGLTERRAKA